MAVLKEFRCKECGDFEGLIEVCPKCGKIGTRVFLTPVGITTGKVAKLDRLLESEFKARGITNYTNIHGDPKVTWKSGNAPSSLSGVAGWGAPALSKINKHYGANLAPITPKVVEQVTSQVDSDDPVRKRVRQLKEGRKVDIIGKLKE